MNYLTAFRQRQDGKLRLSHFCKIAQQKAVSQDRKITPPIINLEICTNCKFYITNPADRSFASTMADARTTDAALATIDLNIDEKINLPQQQILALRQLQQEEKRQAEEAERLERERLVEEQRLCAEEEKREHDS